MKTHSLNKFALGTLLVSAMMCFGGCATSGYRTSERTAATLQSLANRIELAGTQMDIAVTELNNLINNPQPDLRPQFDRFSAAVGKLSALSNSVHKADNNLQARGKVHFDNWEKELTTIQNEVIRSSGQARKLELQGRFDAVRNTCLSVLTSFTPVQADLGDVNRFLNSDLTPDGLTAHPRQRQSHHAASHSRAAIRRQSGDRIARPWVRRCCRSMPRQPVRASNRRPFASLPEARKHGFSRFVFWKNSGGS
jgi:hypothetical protein